MPVTIFSTGDTAMNKAQFLSSHRVYVLEGETEETSDWGKIKQGREAG